MNRAQRRRMERMSQKEFLKIQKQTLDKLNKQFPQANLKMDELKGLKEKYTLMAELESKYRNNE
jgi:hypothetical protein